MASTVGIKEAFKWKLTSDLGFDCGKDFSEGDRASSRHRKQHMLGLGGENNRTCLGSESISVVAAQKKRRRVCDVGPGLCRTVNTE